MQSPVLRWFNQYRADQILIKVINSIIDTINITHQLQIIIGECIDEDELRKFPDSEVIYCINSCCYLLKKQEFLDILKQAKTIINFINNYEPVDESNFHAALISTIYNYN